MKYKSTSFSFFKLCFSLLAIIFIMLPFATTFNEFLTRIVQNTSLYRLLEAFVVPYMSSLLFHILSYLPGLHVSAMPDGVIVNGTDVYVGWNCLGWQSLLLFFGSLAVGLRGDFTKGSVLLTCAFGLAGTFLMNIFRMVFTAALVGWWRGLFVILFHNYFASFLNLLWLFFFWWFAYSFLLEKTTNTQS